MKRVPHPRGDEPNAEPDQSTNSAAFPTRVGMNRAFCTCSCSAAGVPHPRGDEPLSPFGKFWLS